MNWRVEWSAIAAHIIGIAEAATFYVNTLSVRSTDMYSVSRVILLPQIRELHKSLTAFSTTYSQSLPPGARQALGQFLSIRPEVFVDENADRDGAVQFCVTALSGFRAEFEYHITDLAATARKQSERAFIHMQRSIHADPEERSRWAHAFDEGEVACERLGAVRLLAHGIWAFKVDAIGGRTDLVFQEPLSSTADVFRAADALVLTEWKKCDSQDRVVHTLKQAQTQATLYKEGILAGIELASYRFLVLVSKKYLSMPADELHNNVTYRHINIAVTPDSPSVAAR